MAKKTVHIISHSHLDREWYMPFEAHRMRVVELMDKVLDLFENDPDFKYFHLDGQTLPLDDYLEVRPGQADRVQAAIAQGKLRIGPYYILQDVFLISEEANVRNALIGRQEMDKWQCHGEQIGYFPDTFGLSGQIPQIVKETGMKVAAFGRGVKPTGFNNQVGEAANFQSSFSEMQWESPDGSQVLGLLFANWYSNGNEIPAEEGPARLFWDQKLADVERYAATDQLLMLNGCDHQPVQTDISAAIKLANDLYPDYHFIHSNFEAYIESLPKESLENLSTIKGELRSQETDGWYTLANTASSRIYLKQWSHDLSIRLEKVVEPLALLAQAYGYDYPQDQIDLAWKLLLQNYPHDSICGCSVDDVHRGMVTRFEEADGIISYLEEELTLYLGQFDFGPKPDGAEYQFHVWNPDTVAKSHTVTSEIELDRCLFKGTTPPQAYAEMENLEVKNYKVVDSYGQVYPALIQDLGVSFNYDLPKDAFRIPYMARYLQVQVWIQDQAPLSIKELFLVEDSQPNPHQVEESHEVTCLENDFIKLSLNEAGSVDLVNKETGQIYLGQGLLEETGDAGNEYIFKEAVGNRIYANKIVESRYYRQGQRQALSLTYEWDLPESGDSRLEEEMKRVIDITQRQSGRSEKRVKEFITVTYTLDESSHLLGIHLEGDNNVKDHRIRMIWTLEGQNPTHLVDSHYEILERPNQVSKEWENPSNPQVLRQGVAIYSQDDQDLRGLTVSTKGLYEYEVYHEENQVKLALTLLRSTGEMGDWGYFETPEAQCLGRFEGEVYLQLWSSYEAGYQSLIDSRHHFVPSLVHAPVNQKERQGQAKEKPVFLAQFFKQDLPKDLVITSMKKAQKSQATIIRLLNLGSLLDISTYLTNPKSVKRVNLLEQNHPEGQDLTVLPHQIMTLAFD